MVDIDEVESEKKYLKNVIRVLKEQIEKLGGRVKDLSGNITEQMNYAWDKTNRLSDTEFVYALANIQKRSVFAENANKKVECYKKMLQSAYFARVDFDDGEDVQTVYIGLSSLENNGEFLVFDWRAPICSLFYSGELGRASYTISTGETVSGKLLKKRQYKIAGEEIKEIFDTETLMLDNILISMISKSGGSKMKNIVSTIQREQNEIIRKNDVDIFVVQGPAGSGKTSIAMHKLAYLLYSERDKINNTNLMILSPNDIFNNYISSVLPEIGEDNVVQTTYYEYAKSILTELEIVGKIEDVYEIVYSGKKTQNSSKFSEICFKFSDFYSNFLNYYIDKNRLFLFGIAEGVKLENDEIVSLDEIDRISRANKSDSESIYLQGKRVLEKVFILAAKRSSKQALLEKQKKQMFQNLKKIGTRVLLLYKKLYSDKNEFIALCNDFTRVSGSDNELLKYNLSQIFDTTKANLDSDRIEFQDVSAYICFKSEIVGLTASNTIKYVLIDEAQDYSLTQYKILSKLFKNSSVTLLGDLNQSILPFFKYSSFDPIVKIFKSQKQNASEYSSTLKKTYRTTVEINNFAQRVLGKNADFLQIERHGEEVKLNRQEVFDPDAILSHAINLKKSFNTLAIVCKNIEETLLYRQAETFKNNDIFKIVTKNDNVFVEDKIMIIPSYLSKGLEFDAVIVSNLSPELYHENEEQLLYVVLTRALHKLEVFYTKNLSPLIH